MQFPIYALFAHLADHKSNTAAPSSHDRHISLYAEQAVCAKRCHSNKVESNDSFKLSTLCFGTFLLQWVSFAIK